LLNSRRLINIPRASGVRFTLGVSRDRTVTRSAPALALSRYKMNDRMNYRRTHPATWGLFLLGEFLFGIWCVLRMAYRKVRSILLAICL